MIFAVFHRDKDLAAMVVPILLACGIGVYFSLKFEPSFFVVSVLFLFSSFVLFLIRSVLAIGHPRQAYGLIYLCFFIVLAGFFAATLRTSLIQSPMITEVVKFAEISAQVQSIELRAEGGQRLLLVPATIEGFSPQEMPKYLRLTLRRSVDDLRVGDQIEALAQLMPPSPPVLPGAFDFQRHMFFKQIGASGFIYNISNIKGSDGFTLLQGIDRVRSKISKDVIEGADNKNFGGVMAALMTGIRTGVSEADAEAMRASGLAHMLAISGLHVGLFAGAIFFFVRFVMVLIPSMALRQPIKKYAAAFAILGAFIYMLIAGASVPTQRAMIMTFIFFLAIMLDRSPISMRLVAIAASIILLLQPESLISASFQMSFGAVVALVYIYGVTRPFWQAWSRGAGWFKRFGLYLAGVIFTSFIASLATAPFALYHFQQTALYSVFSNVAAVPVLGFLVMPTMMITLMLIPFGFHDWSALVMERGVGLILAIAHHVESLEHEVLLSRAWPLYALILCVVAGLFVIMCRGIYKLISLPIFILSFFIIININQYDILISSSSKLIGFYDGEGRVTVSSRRGESFIRESWLRLNGQSKDDVMDWNNYEISGNAEGVAPRLHCDTQSCHLEFLTKHDTESYLIAFPLHKAALAADCAVVDLIIAPFSFSSKTCAAPQHLDYYAFKHGGAHGVHVSNGRAHIVSDRDVRGDRPWVLLPKSRFD